MHRTILRIYKKDNLGFINKDESYILEDIINIMNGLIKSKYYKIA